MTESFAKVESVQKMASGGILHSVMPGLISYPTMYLHQQQVFEAVREKHHVLVATGTRSGKTESFPYPIIDDLLRQRDQGIESVLRAILVYPMNALADDQLDRLDDDSTVRPRDLTRQSNDRVASLNRTVSSFFMNREIALTSVLRAAMSIVWNRKSPRLMPFPDQCGDSVATAAEFFSNVLH